MYIKNKIGPSTDPCGTLLKADFQFETSPSTILYTLCYESHVIVLFLKPDISYRGNGATHVEQATCSLEANSRPNEYCANSLIGWYLQLFINLSS